MRVRVNGSNRKGKVLRLIVDNREVIWEGNRPHFIEIDMDDGAQYVANPSQLSKKRAQ